MEHKSSRIFSLLLVIILFTLVLFFIVSWGALSKSISWTAVLSRDNYRDEDVFYDSAVNSSDKRGSSDISVTTKSIPVSKQKPDQINTSTLATETPMAILFKKSFKKLPEWDFEDVYNQDAPPRHSTCAQSLRNSKDESFKKAFLPNIRLFLHKDNINMSEWNRLSHFNNPFGFMEYKYDDVMAAVRLIQKPKEPLLHPKSGGDGCVRCAVVGTAGILNSSKKGKEIDAHDYVFRMNGAVIKGHEEDVGNRTSVFVHTAHSITMSPYLFKKYGYTSVPNDKGIIFVMIPEGLRDFHWLEGLLKRERVRVGQYRNRRPWTYYSGQYNKSRFYVLHQDFLRYIRNRFLKSPGLKHPHWGIVRPTNGAFTLFLALHTCDIVSAYGFMTDDYAKYSNYYFENAAKTRVVFYANHDYILEKNTWKKLHNSKIMKLYQRTNTKTVTEKLKQL